MKKLVLFVISILLTQSVCAQQEHMKFMGVELTGSLNSFAEKFEKQHPDFKMTESDGSTIRYKGDFYKFGECEISIISSSALYNCVTKGLVTIKNIRIYTDELKQLFRDLNSKYGFYTIVEKYDNDILKLRWTTEKGIVEVNTLSLVDICFVSYYDWVESNEILKKEKAEKQRELDDL